MSPPSSSTAAWSTSEESALTAMLQRYSEKGELPRDATEAMARQIIYPIPMAFQDTLLGRHVPAAAQPQQRRQALADSPPGRWSACWPASSKPHPSPVARGRPCPLRYRTYAARSRRRRVRRRLRCSMTSDNWLRCPTG
jgi:hypothetical protein